MRRTILKVLPLLLSLSLAQGEEGVPLNEHEEITYALSYFHIVAGTMRLAAHREGDTVQLTMTATSTPSFSRFFPVDNRIESLLAGRPLSLIRQEAKIREGKRQYRDVLTVDTKAKVAHLVRNSQERGTVSVPEPVLDTLGAIYALRQLDLAPSRAFSMDVISGRSVYPLVVVVTGRQEVDTANQKVKTFVVEPRFQKGGLYKRESKLTLFLTTDKRHLPVKIVSQLPFGSLTATLTDANPVFQRNGTINPRDTGVKRNGAKTR